MARGRERCRAAATSPWLTRLSQDANVMGMEGPSAQGDTKLGGKAPGRVNTKSLADALSV